MEVYAWKNDFNWSSSNWSEDDQDVIAGDTFFC